MLSFARQTATLGFTLLLLMDATAADAVPRHPPSPIANPMTIVGELNDLGFRTGYVISPSLASLPVPGEIPNSRIIYLNNCQREWTSTGASGCQVTQGWDDSRVNRSSIAGGDLPAYSGTLETWAQIVACVRETYAPFNVAITEVDPGNVPHFENMVAGQPSDLGLPSNVGGVAPFRCGVIDNAITYTFLNSFPESVDFACQTIAQETAHAFGLEHEVLATDPMTYIGNPPRKRFQNQWACIGEFACRASDCGRIEQNSYRQIMDIFGGSMPPTIEIVAPGGQSPISPGFVVRATVTAVQGVESVELLIDDDPVDLRQAPPYALYAPRTIGSGLHTVTVRARAIDGQLGTAELGVTVGESCGGDDCLGQGADLVCVDGRCVFGETAVGGLGTSCTTSAECLSGQCGELSGELKCTEDCSPAADGCPESYSCASNGAGGGLCWPTESGGCLGCAAGDHDPTVPVVGSVLLFVLGIRRRRRVE